MSLPTSPKKAQLSPDELANNLCTLMLEKKARQPILYRVTELTSYTDYILLVTATSDRHARALADFLQEEMRKRRIRPLGVEGYETGQWILVDFGDAIAHILQAETRRTYDLEGLWALAPTVPIDEPAESPTPIHRH